MLLVMQFIGEIIGVCYNEVEPPNLVGGPWVVYSFTSDNTQFHIQI